MLDDVIYSELVPVHDSELELLYSLSICFFGCRCYCHFLSPLCLLVVFSPSLCPSPSLRLPLTCLPLSQTQQKRYVCHTFTTSICENRRRIVARDTSFKSPCWLIEFVYEAFIHCQTFDREESQVLPRQSFPKVNTGPDMHAHAQKHTHYNTAPRGLGHPADSILFPLNGSCVTKDNLASLWPSYLRGI